MSVLNYMQQPALHPRLVAGVCCSRSHFQAHGLELGEVLEPGLAAELIGELRQLPLGPHLVTAPHARGFHWRCDVELPAVFAPQAFQALFRLQRFLDEDVPGLVGRILDQPLRSAQPGVIRLCSFRRGAWYEEEEGEGIRFVLALTGGVWPADWGGQLQWGGTSQALGWDRLLVLPEGIPMSISLLKRQVSTLFVSGELEPV